MKRLLSFVVIMTLGVATFSVQAQSNKAAEKAAKEQKKAQKKAQEALQNQISFVDAAQAIKDQSFVVEANTLQNKIGRVFYVTPNTNFVSLHNGQATVQIANNSSVYPGPNGLGGITVQGSASGVKITEDKKGNIYLNMSVQGVLISATVMIRLTNDSNEATVTVDPNFSGNTLTLTGDLYPSSQSNVFQGSTI
jgi:hypothetical protein